MIRAPYNEKGRPSTVRPISRKARHPNDALPTSYTTHQPEGTEGPSVAPADNAYESRAEGRASGEPVTRDTGKQATQRRRRQRTHPDTAPEPSSERGSNDKTGNTLTTLDVDDMETPGIPIRERHP